MTQDILKRSITLIDRSLVELSDVIRTDTEGELTDDERADLMIILEVQSTSLARLVNMMKRITGDDEFLSELETDVDVDPYPGEESDEDDDKEDDILKQFIDANPSA